MMKTEKNISNVSSVLGIIAFMGTVITGFLGEKIAAYVLIGLTLLFWLIWLTVKVISLTNQVQKIAQEKPNSTASSNIAGYSIEKHLEDAPLISCKDQKHEKINSHFLNYDECTILINVWVSNENTGIRNPKIQKYILAHRENKGDKEINRFGLSYSNKKKWEVSFSNAIDDSCCISRGDGLQPGWHQFMITWDKSKPQLDFLIDQGSRETSVSFLENWPEHLAETVCVGALTSSDEDSFAETKLGDLWIVNKYIRPTDSVVTEHRRLRASM